IEIHPGKTVDQGAARDLDALEVCRSQQALLRRISQHLLRQCDQLRIVPRELSGAAMGKVAPRGDDLEMRGIAHCPAQIGKAEGAEAGKRVGGWHLAQRRLDLGAKAPLRL